jgi:hypothetical protein
LITLPSAEFFADLLILTPCNEFFSCHASNASPRSFLLHSLLDLFLSLFYDRHGTDFKIDALMRAFTPSRLACVSVKEKRNPAMLGWNFGAMMLARPAGRPYRIPHRVPFALQGVRDAQQGRK